MTKIITAENVAHFTNVFLFICNHEVFSEYLLPPSSSL